MSSETTTIDPFSPAEKKDYKLGVDEKSQNLSITMILIASINFILVCICFILIVYRNYKPNKILTVSISVLMLSAYLILIILLAIHYKKLTDGETYIENCKPHYAKNMPYCIYKDKFDYLLAGGIFSLIVLLILNIALNIEVF